MGKEELFTFDVTLKDLVNLGQRAKDVPQLDAIFLLLEKYWYSLPDSHPEEEEERWNRIRVGSIDVYLDDDKHLCMEFSTRFQFQNNPQVLAFLQKVKDNE